MKSFDLVCPTPNPSGERILMAHGGGGSLMHRLIRETFGPALATGDWHESHDSAEIRLGGVRLAFTTDSFVVKPLFFPGGDIGTLAVCGTVNDLAMAAARPVCLSAGFILEEGLEQAQLRRVLASMGSAATAAGVRFITGDTKVVDRGRGDGMYVNTSGIGIIEHHLRIHPLSVRRGDVCILSGDVGRHGIAVLNARESLALEHSIESDVAPLHEPVLALVEAGLDVHCLRDLTRGGLATALIEIAEASGVSIAVWEASVPVREDVQGACEMLGLDPLYVANEGRFVAFLPEDQAEQALALLLRHPVTSGACRIGRVVSAQGARVLLESRIGVSRVLDMLSGEQLPRIC